ncbi:MAG: hypothetical protein J6W60_04700 [Treponema sp.]|nr:hypothetical protein [Treponema sp.]
MYRLIVVPSAAAISESRRFSSDVRRTATCSERAASAGSFVPAGLPAPSLLPPLAIKSTPFLWRK